MSPQAGATFPQRGTVPAKSAPHPSVLITCSASGRVLARWVSAAGEQSGEGVKTCRRVLRTSKGCVQSAETIPDSAPDTNDVAMGERGGRGDWSDERWDLRISKPAQ